MRSTIEAPLKMFGTCCYAAVPGTAVLKRIERAPTFLGDPPRTSSSPDYGVDRDRE